MKYRNLAKIQNYLLLLTQMWFLFLLFKKMFKKIAVEF